jgi:Methylase involved in ubiquinone/menaquinone biosynthesis
MELDTDNKIKSKPSNWVFDEQVAVNFDEHIRKSVPCYTQVQTLAEKLSDWFTYPNCNVLDFGASTGETLNRIKNRHSKALNLIGFDNSPAMIEQAKLKKINVEFADFEKPFEIPTHSYAVCLFTLQFLRPNSRRELLKQIWRKLEYYGAVFVVEKILGATSLTQDIFQQLYWESKAVNGFSWEQIFNKSKSLRGCMYPKTIEENECEFHEVGFNHEIVFRDSQFCGWLLTK